MVKAVVEGNAVGKSGQRIVEGKVLQPFEALQPAAFVDQVAGKAGGRDDQADDGDGQ